MICKLLISAALKYGLSPLLLAGVIHQESNFIPIAINDKAPVVSYGLGQLTKATAIHHCKLEKSEIMNVTKNLDCAAKVLAYQMKRYNGNIDLALSAYNAGTATQKNYTYVLLVKKRMGENRCGV
jgi:soluble lytic murein transglycosylase-like protein